MALPEGTVTFLRSDIEGSMELIRALGARYDQLNAEHSTLVRRAIAQHGGHVVRTEGDAFFTVFSDAGSAARAAVAIQRSMAQHHWPDGHALKVRIGIHSGVVTRAGDDYGGFEVSRAARIAAAGWGGQIIISEAARALLDDDPGLGGVIRDLGRFRLNGVPRPQRLYQLEAAGLATSFPPLRSGFGPTAHLPQRAGTFVGREADLATLDSLLDQAQLLTLSGPGGIGKTTLAVELARRRAAEFPDGAWFVDLQAVRDPEGVKAEIASALLLIDGPAGPASSRLLNYASERELLLVIDNFEQVVGAAPLLAELIAAARGSKFIVTSRVPLRVAAEQEFPVPPLSLAAADGDEEGEAVRLFVDRTRRIRPGWVPDAETLDIVRETCRLVDGLPLAVELCASRMAALPLAAIRDRLAARLPLPGSGPRDLPDRQRTIEDTVAWSYDLLDPPLRTLFASLSVFRDSFDYEQAEAVCGPEAELDVLDGLVRLTESSLLGRVEDAVGGVRYRLLETIRAIAWERLATSGRLEVLRERHARTYVRLAVDRAPGLEELDPRRSRSRLEADDANFRAALDWAVEAGAVELAQVGAGRLWRYWQLTGRLAEARERIDTALALGDPDKPTPERVRAIAADANVAYWQGDMDRARRGYEAHLALAEELDLPFEIADACYSLMFVCNFSGDVASANLAMERALAAYRMVGDQRGQHKVQVAWANTFAPATFQDPTLLPELESRLAAAEAIEDEFIALECTGVRAAVCLMKGDMQGALQRVTEVMRKGTEYGREADVVMMLPPIILYSLGDRPEIAATALGTFEGYRARVGGPSMAPFADYGVDDPIGPVRVAMGDDAFEEAFDRGRRITLPQVVDLIEAAMASPAD